MIKEYIIPITMVALLSACAGKADQSGSNIRDVNILGERDVYDLEHFNNIDCPPEHAAKAWC